ncbi:uncharacterized protein L969DRAFT_84749 [Mixia osmundae IAM 14324]|uniref:Ras-GEF domain-containing protein n=1 Tax=Mixia osmundae (strain CBS 9802 / IAM 14324 / JCM 22182 / KY 12970) TaxID=764103 RepID=G7DTF4_MIXOS|nr:uncharacterized protein L969DRAFT_84749 [Mixia osmundae IAM 14324]KEI42860.1 hypothetical protein L969DRAFT_84749 [Mixia osmundae IAM 14324]GAA93801.1 hypothetical protein E5Q_00447 [Mixia osmundae IAM 14324]
MTSSVSAPMNTTASSTGSAPSASSPSSQRLLSRSPERLSRDSTTLKDSSAKAVNREGSSSTQSSRPRVFRSLSVSLSNKHIAKAAPRADIDLYSAGEHPQPSSDRPSSSRHTSMTAILNSLSTTRLPSSLSVRSKPSRALDTNASSVAMSPESSSQSVDFVETTSLAAAKALAAYYNSHIDTAQHPSRPVSPPQPSTPELNASNASREVLDSGASYIVSVRSIDGGRPVYRIRPRSPPTSVTALPGDVSPLRPDTFLKGSETTRSILGHSSEPYVRPRRTSNGLAAAAALRKPLRIYRSIPGLRGQASRDKVGRERASDESTGSTQFRTVPRIMPDAAGYFRPCQHADASEPGSPQPIDEAYAPATGMLTPAYRLHRRRSDTTTCDVFGALLGWQQSDVQATATEPDGPHNPLAACHQVKPAVSSDSMRTAKADPDAPAGVSESTYQAFRLFSDLGAADPSGPARIWAEDGRFAVYALNQENDTRISSEEAAAIAPSRRWSAMLALYAQARSNHRTRDRVAMMTSDTSLLAAATIERWIAEVTSRSHPDTLATFFLTYRQFSTPETCLDMLLARFDCTLLHEHDSSAHTIVRIRTFVALRFWLLNYFREDYLPNRYLRLTLAAWINDIAQNPKIRESAKDHSLIKNLKKIIRRLREAFAGLQYSIDAAGMRSASSAGSAKASNNAPDLSTLEEEASADLDFDMISEQPTINAGRIPYVTLIGIEVDQASSTQTSPLSRPSVDSQSTNSYTDIFRPSDLPNQSRLASTAVEVRWSSSDKGKSFSEHNTPATSESERFSSDNDRPNEICGAPESVGSNNVETRGSVELPGLFAASRWKTTRQTDSRIVQLDDLDLSDDSDIDSAILEESKVRRKPGMQGLKLRRLDAAFEQDIATSRSESADDASISSKADSSQGLPKPQAPIIPNFVSEGLWDSDEEEEGDVQAALRRLEGDIDPSAQEQKALRVEAQMQKSQDALLPNAQARGAAMPSSDDDGDDDDDDEYDETVEGTPQGDDITSDADPNRADSAIGFTPRRASVTDATPATPSSQSLTSSQSRSASVDLPSQSIIPRLDAPFQQRRTIARLHILACKTSVLAEQFALIEADLLQAVTYQDLLGGDWKSATPRVLDWASYLKERARAKAQGNIQDSAVAAIIARFNLIANWTASEVTNVVNLESRTAVLSKLIRLAWKSYQLSNLQTMTQIIHGLQTDPVIRLRRTWHRLPGWETKLFNNLKILASSSHDFRLLRLKHGELLRSSQPAAMTKQSLKSALRSPSTACIPFMGVALRDLASLAEQENTVTRCTAPDAMIAPSVEPLPPGCSDVAASLTLSPLLNVQKARQQANLIQQTLLAQELAALYPFDPEAQLFRRCLTVTAVDRKTLAKRSLACEP